MMLCTSTLLPPSWVAIEPQKFSAATTCSGTPPRSVVVLWDVVAHPVATTRPAATNKTDDCRPPRAVNVRAVRRPIAVNVTTPPPSSSAYPEPLQVHYREWLPFPSQI